MEELAPKRRRRETSERGLKLRRLPSTYSRVYTVCTATVLIKHRRQLLLCFSWYHRLVATILSSASEAARTAAPAKEGSG